jgi:hypothetical protein
MDAIPHSLITTFVNSAKAMENKLNKVNFPLGCEACTTARPEDYVVPPPGPLDTLPRTPGAALPPLVLETPKPKEKKVPMCPKHRNLKHQNRIYVGMET